MNTIEFLCSDLSNLMGHGGHCLSWIIVLLDLLTMIYFVVCSYFKNTKFTKMFGSIWLVILTAGSVYVLAVHTCIFTVICMVFTALIILAVLSQIMKGDSLYNTKSHNLQDNVKFVNTQENQQIKLEDGQPTRIVERVTQDIIYEPQKIQEERHIVYEGQDDQVQVQPIQKTEIKIDNPMQTVPEIVSEEKPVAVAMNNEKPAQVDEQVVQHSEPISQPVAAPIAQDTAIEEPVKIIEQPSNETIKIIEPTKIANPEEDVIEKPVEENLQPLQQGSEPIKLEPKEPEVQNNFVVSGEEIADFTEFDDDSHNIQDDIVIDREKMKEAMLRETIERAKALHQPIEMPPKKVKFEEVGHNNGLHSVDAKKTKTKEQKVNRGAQISKIPLN